MKKITFLLALLLYFTESNAQAVSGYSFSQSAETYVAVTGSTSTAIDDDGTQNNIPIGFNFNFGGTSHTTFSISTNGWIRLGTPVGANSWINNLANINNDFTPLIAAFWDDHNPSPGTIKFATIGTAPNRVLEVGWNGVSISAGGAVNAAATGSFKMRLHETTGVIEFVYGSMIPGTQLSASIGLNQAGSYLSVTPAAIATASSVAANNTINITQFLPGTKYTFSPTVVCNGTPAPGDTQAVTSFVCPNDLIQLSLSNTISDFGISYQWQSSINGTDYSDIADAVAPTLELTQNSTTYYRCMVSCGVSAAASTPILITSNPFSTCYCFPSYDNGKTDGDLISNVVISGTTLANNTGTAPINPYYTFFTGEPNYTAVLQSGFTYTMNVTVGTYQQQNVSVWIDYNDDTIFSEDERVGYSAEIDSNGTGVFTIALACDAPAGEHRMRVRDVWNTDAATLSPCANYGYGEVEDYTIAIETASTCQTPQNLVAANVSTFSIELSWGIGCSQISWDIYAVPAGLPAPTEMTTPTQASLQENVVVINNLLPNTSYDFYVRAFCGANGLSPWSVIPLTVDTLPLAIPNDECNAAIALIPGGNFAENAIIATNVGATKTLGTPNPTCGIFGFGGDVWFSVVVPTDGNVTIEVQADPGSPLNDTAMTVFSGVCETLVTLGCSDDEGVGAFSLLNLSGLQPGSTIYARVWEYANDTFGTFQVSAWNPILKNTAFDSDNFNYFPNPVNDYLNLSYSEKISNVAFFNLLGQKVLEYKIDTTQGRVDLSPLPQGTYLVKVDSGNQTKTIKVVKQ